jgi:NHLM bacteriocin system ABC transporter ATP-binding protein
MSSEVAVQPPGTAVAAGQPSDDAIAAFATAQAVTYGANNPVALDGGDTARLVERGALDAFLQPGSLGQPTGRRRFLFRCEPGIFIPPVPAETVPDGHTLVLVGEPETVVREAAVSTLVSSNGGPVAVPAPQLRAWVALAGQALADGVAATTSPATVLRPGDHDVADGQVVRVAADGQALSVRSGRLRLLGPDGGRQLAAPTPDPVPLPAAAWLVADGDAQVSVSEPLAHGLTPPALAGLARGLGVVLAEAHRRQVLADRRTDARLVERRAHETGRLSAAVVDIASTLGEVATRPPGRPHDHFDQLLAACQRIGPYLGVEFRSPPPSYRLGVDPMTAIAMAAGVRHRRVVLPRGWQRRASSAIVAFRAHDGAPLAIVPRPDGRYNAYDPITRAERVLDDAIVASLGPVAFEVYPPLPNRPLTLRDLLAVGLRHQRRTIVVLAVAGAVGGLLALALPVTTQRVFNSFIPDDNIGAISWTAAFLLVTVVSGGFLAYARSMAVVRLSGNLDGVLQAGVWDRLLGLPTTFYTNYSTGDLTSRAYGVNAINAILSNATVSAVVSTVFGVFSLALLFAYSVELALFALAGVVVIGTVLGLLSARQVRYQRVVYSEQGRIFGRLFQLLQGLDKIRIAGREIPAFGQWSVLFARQQTANYRSGVVYCWLATVIGATPLMLSMLLVVVVAVPMHAGLTTGTFVAFVTALAQFTTAATQLNFALVASITVIPLYERLRPVVEAVPEDTGNSDDPGLLSGHIRFENVFFRYAPGADLTLKGVTLEFKPGQNVAIVGPSGAGKSTLVRLLLGFETPEKGSVLYDEKNLASLSARMVRRQVGVVLQDSKPMPGDLLSNIIGNSALTEDDAWRAAESAGLADDIRRMPMGMRTLVSENGATFSGGQVQRLMIARAIAHRPRIVFFDEATSALDNETQEGVTEAVNALDATRIVIAHRLSTIRNADYLYVINDGVVVQQGTYDELLADSDGLFSELVRRQLA